MISDYEIIRSLLRTEKATLKEPLGKYTFLVNSLANKLQVKSAVEKIYKVKVKAVNTFISAGKAKRVRHHLGRTPELKKAIVTLAPGDKIDLG